MGALDTLLQVQEHDTAVDRLLHRRATLPERDTLAKAAERTREIDGLIGEARSQRDEVAARQRKFEDDLAAAERRIAEVERRMYSGEVSASRELQAMAAEVDHLKHRRSMLEDACLQAMEEREPLDAEVARLEEERAQLESEEAAALSAIAEKEAEIDAEIDAERRVREGLSAEVPSELSTTYEELRAKLGGIGAARLVGGSCSGCHLTLSAVELDRLKHAPPDALVLCEQCGRILVR